MKIAEFFVSLGLKGGDSAKKELGSVSSGLGQAKSMALETKVAIAGVIYALQQMMSKSAQAGSDLVQFSASTGLSMEALQKWQYAGRQFNMKAEEVTNGVKSMQSAISGFILHGQQIQGLDLVAGITGDFDFNRIRDTFYVLQKFQQAIQTMPADASRSLFGGILPESMIAAMHKGAFNEEAFKKAQIYTAGQAESLRKVDVAWENLGDNIEKAIGKLNAKHGNQLVNDIAKITKEMLKLTDALIVIGEKLKVFQFMGWLAEKSADLFGVAAEGATDFSKRKANTEFDKEKFKDYFKSEQGIKIQKGVDATDYAIKSFVENTRSAFQKMRDVGGDLSYMRQGQQRTVEQNKATTVNQTFNFQGNDGKNSSDVGRAAYKGTQRAVNSSPANAGGF